MTITRIWLAAVLLLPAALSAQPPEAAGSLQVTLQIEKPVVKPGEKITLLLSIKNLGPTPVGFVVTLPYWKDASTWDPDADRRLAGARRSELGKFMSEYAYLEQLIRKDPTHPVGVLEHVQPSSPPSQLPHGWNPDGWCASTWSNGQLPPGAESRRSISMERLSGYQAEPGGVYHFRWRAFPPDRKPGSPPAPEIVSNVVEIRTGE